MSTWLHTNKRLVALLLLVGAIGGFLALAAVRAPSPLDPETYPQHRDGIVGPCSEFWFGTLQGGHDLAAYLGHAAWRSLSLALAMSATAVTLAFLIGGLWALAQNEPHRSIFAITVLTCLGPTPLLMTVFVLYCFPDPSSWTALVVSMGAVAWAPLALRFRNEVVGTLSEPFIKDARRQVGNLRLLWEEVFPLLRPVIESLAILAAIGAIAAEATIGYLAGKALNNPSLGVLLDRSADAFRHASPVDGIRLLASAAAVMIVLVMSFRLWGGWREDVRLARATAIACHPHRSPQHHGDGFLVSAWLRRLQRPIIEDVFVPLLPGRITVIAGGSGSGKSVTVGVIAGQLDPDLRGTCRWLGAASRKRSLLLPQGLQDVFAPGIPINVYFSSAGIDDNEALARLEVVGLDASKLLHVNRGWKTGKELSGGQAQLVAFWLALELALRGSPELRPEVLIIDEGVSALDQDNAARVGSLLRATLARNPKLAVIVVNHRPDWTVRWADHVAFLGSGRLLWSGCPAKLLGNDDLGDVDNTVSEFRQAVQLLQTRPVAIVPRQDILVEATGVSAGYQARHVVDGVSFTVRAGEALVITGPNGCGKTTLLKALTQSDPSLETSGQITLLGDKIGNETTATPSAIRFAVQNPADNLNPAVTVQTILHRTVKRLGLARGKAAARKFIISACHKASFPLEALNKTPAELNGGARIRAGLARTFLGTPRLLVLDEPTAGLDPETAIVVLEQLRQFIADGDAIVAVMHDEEHIRFLGASVYQLKRAVTSSHAGPA